MPGCSRENIRAKGWGTYLTEIREFTGTALGPVDWTIGGIPPRETLTTPEHAAHMPSGSFSSTIRPGELERVIATVSPLALAAPVSISPPSADGYPWLVASEAANRPLRSDLQVDGASGRLMERRNFSERHWIDRTIGYGIAVHEGQLFGLANQIIGTLTALFLIILSVSGVVTWWKWCPVGTLGAPVALARPKIGAALTLSVLLLASYMPMFGFTLGLTIAVEALLLRRMGSVSRWLGLRREEQISSPERKITPQPREIP